MYHQKIASEKLWNLYVRMITKSIYHYYIMVDRVDVFLLYVKNKLFISSICTIINYFTTVLYAELFRMIQEKLYMF